MPTSSRRADIGWSPARPGHGADSHHTGDNEARRCADACAQDAADAVLRGVLGGSHAAFKQPGLVGSDDPVLAALSEVALLQGIDRSLVDVEGPTVSTAVRAARILEASGIFWHRVILDGRWWKADVGAFFATRRSDGRPLVICPARGGGYRMVDPVTGEARGVDDATVADLADRGIYLSSPIAHQGAMGLALLKFGFRGRWGNVIVVAMLGLAMGLIGLVPPLVARIMIGEAIPYGRIDQIGAYAVLLVWLTMCAGAIGLVQAIAMVRLAGHLDGSLQRAVWDRIMRLPAAFFRGYQAGELANRAMGINTINSTVTSVTVATVLNGAFSTANLLLMFWFDWHLALCGFAIVVFSLVMTFVLTVRQLVWQRRSAESQGRLSGMVLQILAGVTRLRVAGATSRAFLVWALAYAEQVRLSARAQRVANILSTYNAIVPTICVIGMFLTIAGMQATIGIDRFFGFNAAFGQFFVGALGLASAIGSSAAAVPLYRRALPIVQAKTESGPERRTPGTLQGRVAIERVTFGYAADATPTLRDFSMEVAPGEFVAIVGSSGAGKSTVLRLLLGFETPTSGTVRFDGKDIATLDVHALRRQLGVVLQHGSLTPGTIFQSLSGNNPELTHDDAWRALIAVGLDEDVADMPMGMDTFLPEGGGGLSAGQRQRLMIARAITGRPRVVLLDEATSALDNHAQATVTACLAELNVTRIVIAQRLSTVIGADRILVMVDGRIRQSGTYAELMATAGPFRELATRQLA